MAVHGSIGAFNPDLEDWISYTERLENYFIANGIKNDDAHAEQRRAILLSVCGPATYQLVRNLVTPAKPTEKTYAELVKLVQDHHVPKPPTLVARKEFHTRTRRPDESISEFVATLRKLTENCDFGDTLNKMLLDRLLCGCNDRRLQCKLLAEGDGLTFDKALTLAKTWEAAERGTKVIQEGAATNIQVVSANKPQRRFQPMAKKKSNTCFRCGGPHSPVGCRFKDVDCNYCHKRGHIAKACYSRERERKQQQPRRQQQRTHQLTTNIDPHGTSNAEYSMHHASTDVRTSKPVYVTLQVNQADLTMEVDTGAAFSVISEETYNNLWSHTSAPVLKQVNGPLLKTYTGEPISLKGLIRVPVIYNDQSKMLDLLVVKGNGPTLMGRDWLRDIKLDWSELFHLQQSAKPSCSRIIDSHTNVFKDDMGCIEGTSAKFVVRSEVTPKFYRARPVPYSLRLKVEEELDRLERDGILTRVEFSDWAAPIVPVAKRDGSIRICGDYKLTVNTAAEVHGHLPTTKD